MADGSQLEADLLAALAALPESDKLATLQVDTAAPADKESQSHPPTPTPTPQVQPQPQTQERDHVLSSTPPPASSVAVAVAVPPSEPVAPAPAPASATATPAPLAAPSAVQSSISTAAVVDDNTTPSHFVLESHLMANASPIADGSPSLQFAQLLDSLNSHPPFQSQPAAPIANAHAPASNAKRSRSPDPLGDDNTSLKRIKTEPEPTEPRDAGNDKTHQVDAPEDLGALLELELARHSLIKPPAPANGDVAMHGTDDEPTSALNLVTNPVNFDFDKSVNKIMKASSNPIYIMRSMSLPLLGNVAVQLLVRLSQQSRAETESLLADTNSGFRKSYDSLRDVFGPTKRIFSDAPLLSADELEITDSEDRETVRMSNLAAVGLSAFGGRDISLKDVHDNFFNIFIPEEWDYKDSLTELLLSIKTRLFWDSQQVDAGSPTPMELLEALFPINFDEFLKQRSGELFLNAEEECLMEQVRKRRDELVQCAADVALKTSLQRENSADKVMDKLSAFLQSHLGVVIDYAEKYGVNIPLSEEDAMSFHMSGVEEDKPTGVQEASLEALLASAGSNFLLKGDGKDNTHHDVLSGQAGESESDFSKLIEQALTGHDALKETPGVHHDANTEQSLFDPNDLASFIAQNLKPPIEESHGLPNTSTMQYSSVVNDPVHVLHPQYIGQASQQQSSSYQPYPQASAPATTTTGQAPPDLPPHQSLPTAALYERARQAAVAKSSNTARREGLHSTRRPWSPEEEKALMAGLDAVKGPHWSQILSLYGANGSVSNILKDRTQVQLKDKARNLKLFFLKTNSEMPYYLQSVTGELKTRAPTQAARKEAEERARQNQEEEQARLQSIMTLAGGLQNHHPVANASLAPSPAPRGSPATAAMGVANGSMGAGSAQPALGGHSQPPVPISPLIKTEPGDHSSMPKVTTFPPIQPAPAPAQATCQPLQPLLKAQLPPLQPQPSPSQHQLSQQQQQHSHQNQYQQPHQHQQQQVHQPQQQSQTHQTHHAQPQLQSQPQAQTQASVQVSHNPPNPQPIQASAVSPYQTHQQQQQPHAQAPPQAQSNVSSISHTPAFTLPIPPNHHSTPDHAQESKLFDALQAAIASDNQNQVSSMGTDSAVRATT
ncbi:telomere repeat binding factor-domain-containing protein [Podospora fimiseda]|uniref:Telomere repeat binding factor-domain-containing protein n=1 Tax=Podospora fimiseda TaxID=252190 RepID=A0AAN7BGZ2_9PEZI|nr:telomere repeat binding factor-domain-containing protein [Podospora fimiseda]